MFLYIICLLKLNMSLITRSRKATVLIQQNASRISIRSSNTRYTTRFQSSHEKLTNNTIFPRSHERLCTQRHLYKDSELEIKHLNAIHHLYPQHRLNVSHTIESVKDWIWKQVKIPKGKFSTAASFAPRKAKFDWN